MNVANSSFPQPQETKMFRLNLSGDASFSVAKPVERPLLRVLIVEDDEADAYLIKGILTAHPRIGGVIHAIDGVDALGLLGAGFVPDLAFIDLQMPRMNGFALIEQIGRKRFPMIVLTSSSAPSDMARRRLASARQILTKPAAYSQIRNLLGGAIACMDH